MYVASPTQLKHGAAAVKSKDGFEFQKLAPNQIFSFNQVSESESYLGGEIPKEFSIPKFEFNAPFQYLGKLANKLNSIPFNQL